MFFKIAEQNLVPENLTVSVAAEFPAGERWRAAIRAVYDRFVARTLVFRCIGGGARETRPDCEVMVADAQQIDSFFSRDRNRARRFEKFLAAGNLGLFLVSGGEWIAYGWATLPGRGCPPHLPSWTASMDAYWIFHCHTREKFRGRGFYKHLLGQLVSFAHRLGPGDVFIDALPENSASRRAILACGFVPSGVTETFKLWMPRVGSLVLSGSWSPELPHEHSAAVVPNIAGNEISRSGVARSMSKN